MYHRCTFHIPFGGEHPVGFQWFRKKLAGHGSETTTLESIEVVIHSDKADGGCTVGANMIDGVIKQRHADTLFTIWLTNGESSKNGGIAINHCCAHTADDTTVRLGNPVLAVKFFHRTSDSGFDDKTINIWKVPLVSFMDCKVHSNPRLQNEISGLRID